MIVYSAVADDTLAVLAAIAGADGVVPKSARPAALLAAPRGRSRTELDPRALRVVGARLGAGGPADPRDARPRRRRREIAATLGVEPEWLLARRGEMLRGRPLVAA